jgi:hypothetical protein
MGLRKEAEMVVQLRGVEMIFGSGIFEGSLQRRGVDVKPLEIGSREGQKCSWRNLGIHAELRRGLHMAIWI